MTTMSVEESQKVDVKQMSKTERKELRRIVSRRFKMLKSQLAQREREVLRALEKQVQDERKSAVSKIEGKLRPLVKRQNQLAAAYAKVWEEASELGVRIDLDRAHPVQEKLVDYRGNKAVRPSTQEEAHGRLREIKQEAGWTKLGLDELEWQLDEQLAVGELESGTSQVFLASLPTVETLLPLPEGVRLPEIEQSSSF